ncbi:transcription factor bHLH143-like [Cicer arietinum]|uniref:Transcription factor bHLH143-like n=1 Tax=Cicer arietinum TaxID=3827 RepID=A0A1S2XM75_CICAR|nr:transcription factor bHLH143-like [Cicer arietinum]XP_027187647.1 transcription factor bHLH143-like [Cicer arietinum]
MGENCGTWSPQVQYNLQSPNLSSFCAPFVLGKQNAASAAMNPGVGIDMNTITRNEAVPVYGSSALPHMQLGHSNEPHGWFYCLPRFRQGFTCPPNFTSEEKLPPASHLKGIKEEIAPSGDLGFPQKQFLVIDQSGDQTTLIYSSRFGSPVECFGSWDSKFHGCNNLNGNNEPSLRRDVNHVGVGPTFNYKVDENENQGTEIESEMHEDTEEINALLYSDSDGYSTEDDEVTSTGHSPSTMTTHDNQKPIGIRGTAEEVASSSPGKTKKRKLFDVAYDDDVQFLDTASSLKQNLPFDHKGDDDDDAESRCSGSNYSRGSGEMGSLTGNKKMRKEKIQDVLSILQCIVPNGKDKEPIQLLDEAIRCLKSLKLKARALGLDAL